MHRILRRARLDPDAPVLEIGPGRGALTLPLARRVRHLTGVEKDGELLRTLRTRLEQGGLAQVSLVHADILHWPLEDALGGRPEKLQVIGNLPYNISSPLLEKLIVCRRLISRAVLMFQQEVGARLSAEPGGRTYGVLSVLVQYHARVRPLVHA